MIIIQLKIYNKILARIKIIFLKNLGIIHEHFNN